MARSGQTARGGSTLSARLEQSDFSTLCHTLDHLFVHDAAEVKARMWQSTDISDHPEMQPRELLDVTVGVWIPPDFEDLQEIVSPNLPWAEDHFNERVSGKPLNPPPSHEWWPFARKNNDDFRREEKFSHTYPERFWPKMANGGRYEYKRGDDYNYGAHYPHQGIRFAYGDLNDVVSLLQRDPTTRQAFLPVWFPEDTGVVHGERVPCTLGYHFIMRRSMLHMIYYIRSCDYMRHFRDDVYMAGRLCQWVARRVEVSPGRLTMHITSFHIFEGDVPILRRKIATQPG